MIVETETSPGSIMSSVAAACVALVLAIISSMGGVDDQQIFIVISVMLVAYLWVQILQLKRYQPNRWLLNPIVLCSIMTFVMGYGITNVLFFLPEDVIQWVGLEPEITPAMVKLMWLVFVGAIAMWLGYWSPIAVNLTKPSLIKTIQTRFLPTTNSLQPLALPVLLAIAVGARLIQIKLGIFGYSSSYDRLIEMGAFTQYFALASGLGKLALVIVSFQYYAPDMDGRSRKWLLIVLVTEVLFGFLSGFKSAVAMPFVIVAICQYLRTGQFPVKWGIFAIIGIMMAYAVIEPFRDAKRSNSDFINTSIISIATTMTVEAGASNNNKSDDVPLILEVASRFNFSQIGSFGIEFADQNATLPTGSPQFLGDIFLAPLHALVPRLIWSGKPTGDLGLWYHEVVMGMDYLSSTAMGPFSYLYLAGGFIAVFIGFFFIGIMQRVLFFLLQPTISLPGGVVFLAMLTTIVTIDSSFNSIIITLFRELPLVMALQFLLFKRMAPRTFEISGTIRIRKLK